MCITIEKQYRHKNMWLSVVKHKTKNSKLHASNILKTLWMLIRHARIRVNTRTCTRIYVCTHKV